MSWTAHAPAAAPVTVKVLLCNIRFGESGIENVGAGSHSNLSPVGAARVRGMATGNTHRDRVDALVAGFLSRPSDGGNAAFAAFVGREGARARLVHGADGDAAPRTWVRVFNREGIHGYDVDLESDAPLVWRMDGRHPTAGTFRSLTVSRPA